MSEENVKKITRFYYAESTNDNKLRVVVIGDDIFVIGKNAFENDETAQKVVLPTNVNMIEKNGSKEEYVILKDSKEWDFKFRKITPYSLENKIGHFQKDPFSLEHLHYTNNEGKRYAIVISPKNKTKIARELEKIGIDNFFLYPEMYNVSHEINEIYTK